MIYRQTDGNPLFAIELIKVLMDESAGASTLRPFPCQDTGRVRETIRAALEPPLPKLCNELLLYCSGAR